MSVAQNIFLGVLVLLYIKKYCGDQQRCNDIGVFEGRGSFEERRDDIVHLKYFLKGFSFVIYIKRYCGNRQKSYR